MKLEIRSFFKEDVEWNSQRKLRMIQEVDDLPDVKTWQFYAFGDRYWPREWEGDVIRGTILLEDEDEAIGRFTAEVLEY